MEGGREGVYQYGASKRGLVPTDYIVISPSCANPGDHPSLPCLYSFTLRHIAGVVQCEAFTDGLLPLSTHVFSGPVAPLVLVLNNPSLSDLPQLFISHVSTCVRLLFNSSGKYQGAELAGWEEQLRFHKQFPDYPPTWLDHFASLLTRKESCYSTSLLGSGGIECCVCSHISEFSLVVC